MKTSGWHHHLEAHVELAPPHWMCGKIVIPSCWWCKTLSTSYVLDDVWDSRITPEHPRNLFFGQGLLIRAIEVLTIEKLLANCRGSWQWATLLLLNRWKLPCEHPKGDGSVKCILQQTWRRRTKKYPKIEKAFGMKVNLSLQRRCEGGKLRLNDVTLILNQLAQIPSYYTA